MQPPTIAYPTDASLFRQEVELSEPRCVGFYSRNFTDSDSGSTLSISHENARDLEQPLDPIDDPQPFQLRSHYDLLEGRESFRPRRGDGNRIDNMFTWCVQNAPSVNNDLRQVTMDADIVVDRTTLSNVASTPQTQSRFGWKIAATRMGSTVFICPFSIDEEEEHFKQQQEVDHVFRQQKLAHLLTAGGWDSTVPLVAGNSYHRVMTTTLGDDHHRLRLLYACQVDAIDKDGDAVEIRCERENFTPDKQWFKKGLKWYMQSRFSHASYMLVGMRSADGRFLTEVTQVPPQWLRATAEQKGFWTANVSYCFLYKFLCLIRAELMQMPELKTLVATYVPPDPKSKEPSNLVKIEPLPSNSTFLQKEFFEVFRR